MDGTTAFLRTKAQDLQDPTRPEDWFSIVAKVARGTLKNPLGPSHFLNISVEVTILDNQFCLEIDPSINASSKEALDQDLRHDGLLDEAISLLREEAAQENFPDWLTTAIIDLMSEVWRAYLAWREHMVTSGDIHPEDYFG